MAECPVCDHEVRTPFSLNLEAWSHLACPQCNTRLEMKPPRSFALAPLMPPLFVLARRGHVFELIAFVFSFATIFLVLLESVRPKLRLRTKVLPKPDIRLNIKSQSD